MTIAVHISSSDPRYGFLKNFNYRCFSILAGKQPGHHFIFLFDKPFDPSIIKEKNITAVIVPPQIRNRLLEYYWYNIKLPGLLEKYRADLFVSDGINCSIRTSVKQCMVLRDLSFMQKENLFSKSDNRYLKKYFKRFMAKADCIAVTNNHASVELAKIFPLAQHKLHVTGFGSNEPIKVFEYEETQRTKEKFAGGKEYFIAYITDVSASNTTMLLKAFSAFKKRQHSNMQLVLALTTSQEENPVKNLDTYKYRDEVKPVRPENDESLRELTAAAYAAIYLPAMEIVEDKGILALKNNIPLVTIGNDFCKSIYNDAALYTRTDEANIAEKIMLLYKNENLGKDLANTGNLVGKFYSWDNTAAILWQALLQTAAQ